MRCLGICLLLPACLQTNEPSHPPEPEVSSHNPQRTEERRPAGDLGTRVTGDADASAVARPVVAEVRPTHRGAAPTRASHPPPSRPMTSTVLIIGEWSFVPDVDRWATYTGVRCGAVRANKFGGLAIERQTSTKKRRVPLEFRDVKGTDATFARWLQILSEELSHQGDDIIVMMGQTLAPLIHEGEVLKAGSTAWRDEYSARLARLLETFSASSRRVLWLELPPIWSDVGDAGTWLDQRRLQAEALHLHQPRIEKVNVDQLLEDASTVRPSNAERSGWFNRTALDPVLCESKALAE